MGRTPAGYLTIRSVRADEGAYGRSGGMGRGTCGGMGPGDVPPPYFTVMELTEPRPKLPGNGEIEGKLRLHSLLSIHPYKFH